MFHEQNLGRIQDKNAYENEITKLKKEYDDLCSEYHKMVDDVTKMFDWQDGVGKVDCQKAMDAEKYEKKKEELEMQVKMEKLRLARGPRQREGRRAAARRRERRHLAERILAARNRKDMEQFLEAFPPGSNPSDDEIIHWARRRASLHPFQVTRQRWTRILES